jgi:hypothetical protein
MTSIKEIKKTNAYKNFKKSKTQLDLYKENNSSKDILRYVKMNGKQFGTHMEYIARDIFNMNLPKCSSYDHLKKNMKIEQKSARYGKNGKISMWQHIELKHDWDYLICMYLDFNTFNYYITSRKNIKIMIKIGFIRGQGKFGMPNQGYLFNINTYKKKKIFDNYFTPIINEKSLIKFIKKS